MSMSWNLRFWNVNMHLCSVSFSKRVDVSRMHQTFLIENLRMKSCWINFMYSSYENIIWTDWIVSFKFFNISFDSNLGYLLKHLKWHCCCLRNHSHISLHNRMIILFVITKDSSIHSTPPSTQFNLNTIQKKR